jgi:hypothetical protein
VCLELAYQAIEFGLRQETSFLDSLSHDVREREELRVKGIFPTPQMNMCLDAHVSESARAQ